MASPKSEEMVREYFGNDPALYAKAFREYAAAALTGIASSGTGGNRAAKLACDMAETMIEREVEKALTFRKED